MKKKLNLYRNNKTNSERIINKKINFQSLKLDVV